MKSGSPYLRTKESTINIDLQLNLFNTWIKYSVADYYQNIFLAYLDEQDIETIERQIKKEIKQTIQKTSLFFIVQKLEEERHNQLKLLSQMLLNKSDDTPQQEIVNICSEISKLRNINLELAESLIKMYQKYKCYNNQSLEKQTSLYENLFDDLDKQNRFIKRSVLNQYIKFDDGYDPFLMDPYQKFHRNLENHENDPVKSLYNLNISYVYRLMKVKNTILEIRSKFKEIQPASQSIQSIVSKKSKEYTLKKQNDIDSSRLVPSPIEYKPYEPKTVEISMRKQNISQYSQPIKIMPIKIVPSRQKSRTTIDPNSGKRSRSPPLSDNNYQLIFSRVSRTDSLENYEQPRRPKKKYQKIYLQTEPSEYQRSSKMYNISQENGPRIKRQPSMNDESTTNNTNLIKSRPQRLQPIRLEKTDEDVRQSIISRNCGNSLRQLPSEPKRHSTRLEIVKQYQIKETPKIQPQNEPKPIPAPQAQVKIEQHSETYQIKNYNPIKKNQFERVKKGKIASKYDKYDFTPEGHNTTITNDQLEEEDDTSGLTYERPIYKFSNKKQFYQKKFSVPHPSPTIQSNPTKRQMKKQVNPQRKIEKTVPYITKVEQECQTITVEQSAPLPQMKSSAARQPQPQIKTSAVKQNPKSKPQQLPQIKQSVTNESQPKQPSTQPKQPSAQPKQPSTQPKQPSTQPKQPSTKPKQPIAIQQQPNNPQQEVPAKINKEPSPSNAQPSKIISSQPNQPQPQPKKGIRSSTNSIVAQPNPPKQKLPEDLDQTLENEVIIDERPEPTKNDQPLIRTIPKQQASNPPTIQTNNQPLTSTTSKQSQQSPPPKIQIKPEPKSNEPIDSSRKNEPNTSISIKQSSGEKKEVKMKIGKSNIVEIITLLQTAPIKQEYKTLFGMQKLMEGLKLSQTYLTEFHINNVCAIIGLCSPIPSIGMAIKLWAPIDPAVDFTISNNLFLKYVQHIEKSTTAEKIMFSGNGEAFKELKAAEFNMKKQNLYERLRKLPAKQIEFEFKPFLYVECSTVNFNQSGTDTILFSQQIQQFNEQNCHVSNFLAQIDKKAVPNSIQPLVKISENLQDFQEVNKILTAEDFDNYQAGDMKISSINLLRLYLNTHFKSNFVACDGFMQFVGTLLYEKGEQRIVSLQTSKNNGVMYFAKNMSIKSMIEKSKASSSSKTKFCVKMFHKTLYGKLPSKPKGCYANWEINLTWEDEMQGKIKHKLPQGVTFGPQNFCIGIQIEKEMLYCTEIHKDDFIY